MAKAKKTILISAGPTIELLDPVRYLSNRSSGKMGYSLAEVALDMGYKVILISGPSALKPPKGCEFVPVETAREMQAAMLKYFPKADITFKAAAVADYRPWRVPTRKMKKKLPVLSLFLVKNPDILKLLGKKKKPGQTLVGFAAETHNGLKHARQKMEDKNLDWIVLNDVSRSDIGFESDKNEVVLLSKFGDEHRFKKQSKVSIAKKIFKKIA